MGDWAHRISLSNVLCLPLRLGVLDLKRRGREIVLEGVSSLSTLSTLTT
jgi:hypothetical protein